MCIDNLSSYINNISWCLKDLFFCVPTHSQTWMYVSWTLHKSLYTHLVVEKKTIQYVLLSMVKWLRRYIIHLFGHVCMQQKFMSLEYPGILLSTIKWPRGYILLPFLATYVCNNNSRARFVVTWFEVTFSFKKGPNLFHVSLVFQAYKIIKLTHK